VVWLCVTQLRLPTRQRWTPERACQAIQDALPLGSTRQQIEVFLDQNGFPHQFFGDYQDVKGRAEQLGIAAGDFGGYISTDIPDPDLGSYSGWLRFGFYLNKSGGLSRLDVDVQRHSL
jgi:hypothetical protein